MSSPDLRFTLSVRAEGSSFDPEDLAVGKPPQAEVARILRKYAAWVENTPLDGPPVALLDEAGNTCGHYVWEVPS